MKALILLAAAAFAQGSLPPMPNEPPRVDRPQASLTADKPAEIFLSVKLPKGWRLHPDQIFMYRVAQTTGDVRLDPRKRKGMLKSPKFPIRVPFTPPGGPSEVMLQVAFYYCPSGSLEGCKAYSRYFLFPVVGAAKEKTRKVSLTVEPD
jgi:hypothetical protein